MVDAWNLRFKISLKQTDQLKDYLNPIKYNREMASFIKINMIFIKETVITSIHLIKIMLI